MKITEELLRVQPDHPRAAGNLKYYENALNEEGGRVKKKGEDGLGDADDQEDVTIAEESPTLFDKTDEKRLYEKLCRGEDEMTEA